MEGSKRIILQALVVLSFSTLCSCIDKVVYTYEDIVITRYDYWDERGKDGLYYKSVYYCNNSDKKCKIEVFGAQNYYEAMLCINRETKKVWIMRRDCYIQQQKVDTIHFQGEIVGCSTIESEELKKIRELIFYGHEDLLEKNYECFALMGLGSYVNYEKNDSKIEFPNSAIEAQYFSVLFLAKYYESKLR